MQKIVVTKFTPDKIVPNPDSTNPMIHMSPPSPGEYTELVSGGGDEAEQQDEPTEQEHVVAEQVQPGEGHVRGADLQRQNLVGEPDEQRGGEQQQHDRAVHGEKLVVLLIRYQPLIRAQELGPHDHRHDPGGQEETEGGDQIEVADHLMVGRREPGGEH